MALDPLFIQLLEVYRDAYKALLKRLTEQELRGLSTYHTEALLTDIEQITQQLLKYQFDWLHHVIPLGYQEGSDAAVDKLTKRYGMTDINVSFGGVHRDAISVIIRDTFQDVAAATEFMADNLKEAIRQAAKEVYRIGIVTGETRRGMTAQLVKKLNLEKGFTAYYDSKGKYIPLREYADSLLSEQWVGFVDAAGRRWDLENYVEMLTRTKVTEAVSRGTENRLTSNGLDLVIITAHGAEDWCRFYENRIFSISGKSTEYPPLSEAPNGGTPFHPRCKHRESPIVEKFESEEVLNYGKGLDKQYLGLNTEKGYADQVKLRAMERETLHSVTHSVTINKDIDGTKYLGKIKNINNLGTGASETFIGIVNGKKYVFKADEPVGALDMLSSNAEGEILASKIFNKFGLPAPGVQYGIFDVNGDQKRLMAFEFVDNGINVSKFLANYGYDAVDLDQFRRMQVIDLLIGNGDRHNGNFFLLQDGSIIPIDHNMAFATDRIINPDVTWQKCFVKAMPSSLESYQTPQYIFLRNTLGKMLYQKEGTEGYEYIIQQIQEELTDEEIKKLVNSLPDITADEERKKELIEVLMWRRDNLWELLDSINK